MQTTLRDIETEAKEAQREMIDTGKPVHIETEPSAIYSKQQYETGAVLYILLPQHKIALPYTAHTAQEQILHALIKCKDVTSSQDYTDYPIVTHKQLAMWYASFEILPILKTIPVYKPAAICSGWEQQQIKKSKNWSGTVVKTVAKLEKLKDNPFYQRLPLEQQKTVRQKELSS